MTNSSIRTFLVTDIVGSSRLWELDPRQMAKDLELHNQILNSLFSKYEGIPFKNVGDGFIVAFRTSEEAIRCSIEIRDEVERLERIQIRIGLHAGIAQEIGGDFFGSAVNRASRVCGLAQGGQIFASETTWSQAEEWLKKEFEVADLGTVSLAGLVKPEKLVQVLRMGESKTTDLVRLEPLSESKNNFPSIDRPFVGRQEQLSLLEAELLNTNTKCLTVFGFGGMGKSTLILEAARLFDQRKDFPGGIRFIPCEAFSEAEELRVAIENQLYALSTDLGFPGARRSQARIKDSTLFLLDCFENIVPHAKILAEILDVEPHVKFLVSSRKVLSIPGEKTIELEPFPPVKTPLTQDPSAKLFLQTAHSIDPHFAISKELRSCFFEVLKKLEGIPLAIVLTASRIRHLSLFDIERELQEGQLQIVRSNKSAFGKHSSMELVVQHSVDLLDPDDLEVAIKVSTFVGGFTLKDARAVLGRSLELIDNLANLRDQSLLVSTVTKEGMRYRQLDSIREFLQRRFEANYAEEIMPRFAQHYSDLAHAVRTEYLIGNWQIASQRLLAEAANFRKAILWAKKSNDIVCLRTLIIALARPLLESAMIREFDELYELTISWPELAKDAEVQIEILGLAGQRSKRHGSEYESVSLWKKRADICLQHNLIDDYVDSLLDIVFLELEHTKMHEVDATMQLVDEVKDRIQSLQIKASVEVIRARIELKRGNQREARSIVLALFNDHSLRVPDSKLFFVNLNIARLLREFGEVQESLEVTRDLLKFAVDGQFSSYCCSFLIEHAQSLEASGEVEAAARSLLTARMMSRSASSRTMRKIHELIENLAESHEISQDPSLVQEWVESRWDFAVAQLLPNETIDDFR